MVGRDYKRNLDLVSSEPDGGYIRLSRLTTGYRELAKTHGFEGVSLHDLQHSHATALLRCRS